MEIRSLGQVFEKFFGYDEAITAQRNIVHDYIML